MIICDCVVKIACFALVLPIYSSIYSIHGSQIVGRILCGFLSVLATELQNVTDMADISV